MNTNNSNLNLARKWRPKTFNEIVGQNIPIKTLLNGLYLKKFFPVYLFAGQRGCGKTSSARIFAAAINCQNLKKFQEDPKEKIPCLECESCQPMLKNNHPDFIEIDAASHTGVDNVRQILENSSYMPLAGNKKIYLIDEAHMLSKAAFNAFLKVLEEPPSTVLFILATTEIHKIPETVLSRCFQVIFRPINSDDLKKHLINLSK
ncbi:MAG: DNA polymerase III subunit gamma/tau [bacterium]